MTEKRSLGGQAKNDYQKSIEPQNKTPPKKLLDKMEADASKVQ